MKRFVLIEVQTARQDDGSVRVDAVEIDAHSARRVQALSGVLAGDWKIGIARSPGLASGIALEEVLQRA